MATAQPTPEAAPERWSLAQRVLFRFVFCYEVLYCTPAGGHVNIFGDIPGASWAIQPWINMWHTVCPWVAIHIFGLSGQAVTYFRTGSGDTTLGYIQNLLFLVIALTATLIWSVADRRRTTYSTLYLWLRLLVRYTLAFTLFGYGFAKLVPQQFQPTRMIKLLEPYGEFSPMGVLWNFMGASMPYTVFSGAAEVLGGLLLLFRRTTTLGALVSFAVLANVVALNFCYDVPVKLYSTNLLLMAVFLAAPDLRRLCDVLLLNRAANPADAMAVRFQRRGLRIAAMVFWVLFVGYTLVGDVIDAWSGYQRLYAHPVRPSIYGVYDVDGFQRFGQEITLGGDTQRWRRVAIDQNGIVWRTMNDVVVFAGKYDEGAHTVTANGRGTLTWSRVDTDNLVLQGTVDGTQITARLRKLDPSKLLLVNRGFHWINELPFNR